MVLQVVWYFFLVYIDYLVIAYFNLICFVISTSFEDSSKIIKKACLDEAKELESQTNKIIYFYFKHNETCELVDESNNFWSNYIFWTVL